MNADACNTCIKFHNKLLGCRKQTSCGNSGERKFEGKWGAKLGERKENFVGFLLHHGLRSEQSNIATSGLVNPRVHFTDTNHDDDDCAADDNNNKEQLFNVPILRLQSFFIRSFQFIN